MKTQYQNRNEEFFKLSAAATDEFNKVIVDVREQEFHDSIREILVNIFLNKNYLFKNEMSRESKFGLIKNPVST